MRDRVAALQARHHLGRRVPAVERVGPVRPDQQQRPAVGLGQPFEERDALRVGPVEVVEHHDARRPDREIADDIEREPDPLVGRARRVAEELDALVGGPAAVERVDQELERAPERSRVGLAGVHRDRLRQPSHELAHESRLADTGFPTDERDRGRLARIDEPGQPVQLLGPADHLG